jgi:uncharacterized membrane protein
MVMTQIGPEASERRLSNRQIALIVYVLYCIGYFVGITWLIGVIIAHIQYRTAAEPAAARDADPLLASHYRFQIRTFWIGLLYLVVGILLTFVVIGVLVLLWWLIWTLVRNIKGVLALNDDRPIADPGSWLFG